MKTFKQFTESLWANIHKKRQRIKRGSGEKMRKKGEKGAPTPAQMQRAKGEGFREDKEDEKLAKTIDVATKKAELAKRVNQMTKQGKATLSRMTDKEQKKQRGDQIKQQIKQVKDAGITVVATSLFISKKGIAKLNVSVAKGKREFDKRNVIKDRESKISLKRIKKNFNN